ncbi:MAG: response regulator [Sulfuricurvum sp.]|nr:response regulator [Sulfuricurvum sp.]
MFTSQNLTLLCINGDVQTREKNTLFMRKNELRVFTANNTIRAYDLYQTHKIDLIIIDIPLPDENGLDFIRHLRQLEIDTPVIITTASTDKEILIDAINLDISRYLIKPFDNTELLDAIQVTAKKLFNVHGSTFLKLHHGFSYDTINKSVNRPDGSIIHLSKKEYLLLELLLENKRKIIPYETIESTIWHSSTMSIDTLRTLVRAIRKKTYPGIIINNNAIGYKIDF